MLSWKCENNLPDGKCETKKKTEICCDPKHICGALHLCEFRRFISGK